MMPVGRLVPYIRNARTHDDDQIAQIAASIAEFGFTNPILIGEDDVIVAGHGRLMAARRLGLETVPVIVLAPLSEAQRRALVIADNRIAENAGWDRAMLAAELAALRDDDFDLELVGFDDAEIDELMAGLGDLGQASGFGAGGGGSAEAEGGAEQEGAPAAAPPAWRIASASRRSRSSKPARAGGRIASAPGWNLACGRNLGAVRRRADRRSRRMRFSFTAWPSFCRCQVICRTP